MLYSSSIYNVNIRQFYETISIELEVCDVLLQETPLIRAAVQIVEWDNLKFKPMAYDYWYTLRYREGRKYFLWDPSLWFKGDKVYLSFLCQLVLPLSI